jgi:hypothetical protein
LIYDNNERMHTPDRKRKIREQATTCWKKDQREHSQNLNELHPYELVESPVRKVYDHRVADDNFNQTPNYKEFTSANKYDHSSPDGRNAYQSPETATMRNKQVSLVEFK